jgi:alkaline phosphatase
VDLDDYTGGNSPYRSEDAVRRIYGYLPENTVSPDATYLDQTNVYDIQKAALESGRKHIFLVVFDGMDWNTTRAAAIAHSGKVGYDSGRGAGLHLLDYTAGGTSQFGFMVTSPHNDGTDADVNTQTVRNLGGTRRGGYDPTRGGPNPWSPTEDLKYLIGQPKADPTAHAYTDSSSSAVSMTAGAKTYNDAVNVDPSGGPLTTIAHEAQEQGYAVGVVTSVPISHATPAAAYAHNVHRDDYQDLTRDLLGRPSISHPDQPLPGMDVVIGAGWGESRKLDNGQGKNFVPGNAYLTESDLHAIDVQNGGAYVVTTRRSGVSGADSLQQAAADAARQGKRLLGFYGVKRGHLPFRTADGDFEPSPGRNRTAEEYTPADIRENPTLAEMTDAALTVLSRDRQGFWLMVEAGDVDWANHDNNLDNSIGAVLSGDAAVKTITDWVERHSDWDESLLIVTADHGHYLVLTDPERLIAK